MEWYEVIEVLAIIAVGIGAVYNGRRDEHDRQETRQLRQDHEELKADFRLLGFRYEETSGAVADHEDRIRGLEKRRRTTK